MCYLLTSTLLPLLVLSVGSFNRCHVHGLQIPPPPICNSYACNCTAIGEKRININCSFSSSQQVSPDAICFTWISISCSLSRGILILCVWIPPFFLLFVKVCTKMVNRIQLIGLCTWQNSKVVGKYDRLIRAFFSNDELTSLIDRIRVCVIDLALFLYILMQLYIWLAWHTECYSLIRVVSQCFAGDNILQRIHGRN